MVSMSRLMWFNGPVLVPVSIRPAQILPSSYPASIGPISTLNNKTPIFTERKATKEKAIETSRNHDNASNLMFLAFNLHNRNRDGSFLLTFMAIASCLTQASLVQKDRTFLQIFQVKILNSNTKTFI